MMKEQPLISVIVPCYNVEEYLPKCIESILTQTYQNLELILVDDGSPDQSGAIIDEYASRDKRIVAIHKKNEGIVKARLDGTLVCKGNYLCYVDSDDYLDRTTLEKLTQIIAKYSPEIICYGRIIESPSKKVKGSFIEKEGYYNKEQIVENIYPSLMEREDGYYFPHSIWGKCFKREIAMKIHPKVDVSMNMGEDFVFVVAAVVNAQSLYILDDCLYYYRYNPTSMTKSKKAYSWSFPKYVNKFLLDNLDLDTNDFREQYYRAITHVLMRTATTQFYLDIPYRQIRNDINTNLNQYTEILRRVQYKSVKHKLMALSLIKRWYLFIRLYSVMVR